MFVSNIINEKGAGVVTARAEDTLATAARVLDEHRIGAVVVTASDGAIQGVLSERDIAREVARNGAAALEQPISVSMSRQVVTVTPSHSLDQVMTLMTDRRIRHLPVIEGGALAGIISIGDVVKRKIALAEAEAEAMKAYIAAS